MKINGSHWLTLLVLNLAGLGVLGLYDPSHAQTPPVPGPFANPVELQLEMINQLKTLNTLTKEQNELLRSGKLQVIVASPAAKPK